VTVTVTALLLVPPPPVQAKLNVLVVVSAVLTKLPEGALVPLHAPLALQLVAFVDDQLSVVMPPLLRLVAEALNVTVDTGGGTDPELPRGDV
jgi:hypothetical protein